MSHLAACKSTKYLQIGFTKHPEINEYVSRKDQIIVVRSEAGALLSEPHRTHLAFALIG